MRSWKNLAAPDDQSAWWDVDGFWPTPRGTYEKANSAGASTLTATGTVATAVRYAFAARLLSGRREYAFVVDAANTSTARALEYSGGSITVRTFATAPGDLYPTMAQFGTATIIAKGSGGTTEVSTGGNFSSIAGAPNGGIVVVCSNVVLIFNSNTSADGWHASDVADYTNWTTGEAASGRLIATPGPITAAVTFNDAVYVFKSNSIYRMRYVGGTVKWTTELVSVGIGCINASDVSTDLPSARYFVCAGKHGILFVGGTIASIDGLGTRDLIYYYDGANAPVLVNPETRVDRGAITYNPQTDTFAIYAQETANSDKPIHYFCATTGMWGMQSQVYAYTEASRPVMGEYGAAASTTEACNRPVVYTRDTADQIKRIAPTSTSFTEDGYLQTSMAGRPDRKTRFKRLIPRLRKGQSVTPSLSLTLWRELADTSAQSTRAITQSTDRKRFDLQDGACVDNFARFKVTYGTGYVEVDDFMIDAVDAGQD